MRSRSSEASYEGGASRKFRDLKKEREENVLRKREKERKTDRSIKIDICL